MAMLHSVLRSVCAGGTWRNNPVKRMRSPSQRRMQNAPPNGHSMLCPYARFGEVANTGARHAVPGVKVARPTSVQPQGFSCSHLPSRSRSSGVMPVMLPSGMYSVATAA